MSAFATLNEFLNTNWGWAAGLAGAMLALTSFAATVLNQDAKDSLALWLSGAESEETWAKRFTTLFDALFSDKHLSLRCFIRSAIASLLAVVVIWSLMGLGGAYGVRLQANLALGEILLYALAVNILADYVSLLESRWLLSWLAKPRPIWVHIGVLIADFLASAAIIWVALVIFLSSPLYQGEGESFAEILGVFSVFSVLFYSTFLTSLWSWAFILSAWILRFFNRWRPGRFLEVQKKPLYILGLVLACIVFLGSLGTTTALRKDDEGLTAVDRSLCSLFAGEVCLDVATLTDHGRTRFNYFVRYCAEDLSGPCFSRSSSLARTSLEEVRELLAKDCGNDDPESCGTLAFFYYEGLGGTVDHTKARELLEDICGPGDLNSCNFLGHLLETGKGGPKDGVRAKSIYSDGCNSGNGDSCGLLGHMIERGLGGETGLPDAILLYRQGCSGGSVFSCELLELAER